MNKENIEKLFEKLNPPRVGSIGFGGDGRGMRDSCIDMFKDIFTLIKPKNILEIGTHMGHSSLIMLGLSGANIVSVDIGIEWCGTGDLETAQRVLSENFPNRFLSIIGDSTDRLTINKVKEVSKDYKFDFIFIDGNHTYGYCKKDIETAIELNIPYIAIDDYTTCQDMRDSARDCKLELIKIYENIHNGANIGIGFFKNPFLK